MKKMTKPIQKAKLIVFSLMLFLLLSTSTLLAQVTVSGALVGNGSYTTLNAATAAINAGVQTGANIVISITGNTSEGSSQILLGSGAWNTLQITPVGGNFTISGTTTAGIPMLDFNGADNVTINGKNNGTESLTIVNNSTSSSSGTATIRFINDAKYNLVTNCTILGGATVGQLSNGGTIFFSTANSGGTGNDSNTISFNNIGPISASLLPVKAIYANGTTTNTAINNSNNAIVGNHIYDFFAAASNSNGIYVNVGNTAWSISANKFYQTASRTITTASSNNPIQIANTTAGSGENFVITNNIIGYSSAAGTGTYTIAGTVASLFNGIIVSAATSSVNNQITGNVISDISLTTSSSSTTGGGYPFAGINITTACSTVFVNSNRIRNILVTGTGTGNIAAIDVNGSSSGTFHINNNVINSISRTSNGSLYGIRYASPNNVIVNGDSVTNLAINNTSSTSVLAAIFGASSGVNVTYTNNYIANLTSTSTGSISIIGLREFGSSGNKVYANNTILNLSLPNTSTGTITGISVSASSSPNAMEISRNTIGSFTGGTTHYGINQASSSTVVNLFRNKIYGFTANNALGLCFGIYCSSGTTHNIYNNVIGDLQAVASTGTNSVVGIGGVATSTYNVFFNNVVLRATSTSTTTFGTSCISLTSTATQINLRNNVLVNLSTPAQESANLASNGIAAVVRISGGTANTVPSNYSTACNKNLFWCNPAAGTNNHLTYVEGTSTITNPRNTLANVKSFFVNREQGSVEESLGSNNTNLSNLTSLTGTDLNYLAIANGTSSQAESGADVITTPSIVDDFFGNSGNRASSPDIGAHEFNGLSPAPNLSLNSITPASNQCSATPRLVSLNATTPAGTVTGVSLTYNNGAGNTTVAMVNTTGNTWEFTIPAAVPTNATVTWSALVTSSIGLTRSYAGASYQDDPLFGVTAQVSSSSNPICIGSTVNLSAIMLRPTTLTLGAGASTSSGAGSTFLPGSWGGAKTQYLIRASELTAMGLRAGNITSLGFEPTTAGQTYTGFSVSVGHTAVNAMNTAFITAGLTQVFAGTLTNNGFLPVANTVNTLNFGTGTGSASSFNWDGVSNIVVTFSWSSVPSATTSSSSTMRVDAPGYTCTVYAQNDSYTPAAMLAVTTGTTASNRPRFTFTGNAGAAITSISWSDGNNTIGSTNPIAVTASSTTTYSATLSAAGCTFNSVPSVTLNVANPPATPTAIDAFSCPGLSNAMVVSNSTFTTTKFKWYNQAVGGSLLQNSTANKYQLPLSVATTFHVSEIDTTTQCESQRVQLNAGINTLTITPTTGSFCAGAGAKLDSLYATSSNIQFTSFTWNKLTPSANFTGTTSGSATEVSITQTSDFSLTASDGNCSQTAFVSIGVYDFPIPNLSVTPNDTVTQGTQFTVNSGLSAGNFSVAKIPFAPFTAPSNQTFLCNAGSTTAPNGTTLSSGDLDDGGWLNIPLGFSFNYFGKSYSNISVGTNGTMMFGLTSATPLNTYTFTGGFPSTSNPANVIAAVSQDNRLTTAGSISYWTTGYAPNRKFVTQYNAVPAYNSSGFTTAQVILFETTGIIEIHITNSTTSYAKYVGLQDSSRTIGAAPINGATATITTSTAYRFSPPSNYSTVWSPSLNLTGATSGTNVFNTATNFATTGPYNVSLTLTNLVTGCTNAAAPSSIDLWVVDAPLSPVTQGTTICGPKTATITVTNAASLLPSDSITWYDAAIGGNLVGRGAVFNTPLVAATTTYFAETYNLYGKNIGGRVPTLVTYVAPPALPISSNQTVCNNNVSSLTVTSQNTTYTNFDWTPITNLFDDPSCTNPVVSGGNYFTVYFKSNTPGSVVYTCTGSNVVGCKETASSIVTVQPAASALTIAPLTDTLCNSGTTVITVNSGSASFANNSTRWIDTYGNIITGQTSKTFTTPVLNSSQTYSFEAIDGVGNSCLILSQDLVFDSIAPPITIGSAHCGEQVPTCSASGALPGQFYRWYTTASGGTPIANENGATLTNYLMTATQTLYVSISDNTCESARTPVIVNVTVPDALAVVSNRNNPLCLGLPRDLVVNQTGSTNNYALTWTSTDYINSGMSGATPTSVGAPVSITPTLEGTYYFTITAIESATGCIVRSRDTLTVINPFGTLTNTVSMSPSTICQGAPATLTLNSTNSGAGGGSAPNYIAPPAITNPTTDEDIGNVRISSGSAVLLNNTTAINSLVGTIGTATGTAGSFSNFTSFNATPLNAGQSYTFSLSSITTGANYNNSLAFYIDYNRNGIYTDAGERVFAESATVSGPHTASGTFTIPATASAGLTRMRVIVHEGLITSPTQSISYGEYEEYLLFINPAFTTLSWSDGISQVGTGKTFNFIAGNPTNYELTMTLQGCQSKVQYAVNPIALPTAPVVTNASQCGIMVPSFIATGANNGEYRWFEQSTDTAAIANETNGQLNTYTVSKDDTLYVAITNGTCLSTKMPAIVSVVQPDSIIANTNIVSNACINANVNLLVSQNQNNNNYQFTWEAMPLIGSGLSAPTSGSIGTPTVVAPTDTGTFIYKVSGFDPNSGCQTISTISVRVVNPFANINTNITVTPATVCQGSAVQLSIGGASGNNPTYIVPPAVANPTNDEDIANVTIRQGTTVILSNATSINSLSGSIGTASGTAGSYSNFTAFGPYTLNPGQLYNFSLTSSTTGTPYNNSMAIYIDYNRNGVFTDNGERVYAATVTTSGAHTETGSFTVPSSVSYGVVRMRVICNEGLITSPTQSISYGEYEEYSINLSPAFNVVSWSDGTSTIGSGNTVSTNVNAATNYEVTMDIAGCIKTAQAFINPSTLPVSPVVSNSSHCGNLVPTCMATGTSNGSYRWYTAALGGTAIVGEQNGTLSNYKVNSTRSLYVSITDGTCESLRSKVDINVTVPDSIFATSSVTSNACVNGNVNLNIGQIVQNNNNYGFSWEASPITGSGLSGATNAALGTPLTVVPTASGTYTYTVTGYEANSGCMVTNSINVTVINPLKDVLAIAVSSNGLSAICQGSSTTLSVKTYSLTPANYTNPSVSSPLSDEDIGNVTISQNGTPIIDNTTTGGSLIGTIGTATGTAGSYSNFTNFGPFSMTAGQLYNFSLRSITQGTINYGNSFAIYIDYNRNGVYTDAGERVYAATSTISGPHTETGSFTIPLTAANGLTRMRVICNEGLISSPTQSISFGEFEEYALNISSNDFAGGLLPSPITYAWTNGSSTIGTGATITNAPAATTVYNAILTNAGCTMPSSPVTVSVDLLPVITSITNVTNATTSSFDFNWSMASNANNYRVDIATDSLFVNKLSGFNNLLVNATTVSVSGLQINSTYYARMRAENNCGFSNYSITQKVETAGNIALQVKAIIEGLYTGSGNMTAVLNNFDANLPSSIADSITVELHENSSGLYNTVFSQVTTLSVNGIANLVVPSNFNSGSYYIVLKHRNSIETWSAFPVFMGSTTTYDFTTAASQAYGSNLIENPQGQFMVYSGDINQDGFIDGNDFIDVDNDNAIFASGYLYTDLNGDTFVDGNDFIVIDNNNTNFIGLARP